MRELRSFCATTILITLGLAGCGGDGDAASSQGSSSTSSSGNGGAGGMGAGGMGAGGMGTGGMGTGGMGTGGRGTGGIDTGGTGGMGGGGPVCSPDGTYNGKPVDAPANTWTWVPVPEALCRSGSSTGFGIRINPGATKLVIFLQGGGACFNSVTCSQSRSSFGSSDFDAWKGSSGDAGLFDAANTDNAVKDASFVFVPYCTGDVHTGNATGVDVPGTGAPKAQAFVGHANIGHYPNRIIPTFTDATQVILVGESAGGFGAFYNYDRMAQAFCPRPLTLVDDSGPPMSDRYMAPCLQKRWRTLWNMDGTLPPGCEGCTNPDGGGLVNTYSFLGRRYPGTRLGLISSDQDSTISTFYGFGANNCANLDSGPPEKLSGAKYAEGLAEVREQYVKPWPAWGTYTISSTEHTWVSDASYGSTTVKGVSLVHWVADVVNRAPSTHVFP